MTTTVDTHYDLPVPHIYSDGSVSSLRVRAFDAALSSSAPHISNDDSSDMIILGSADHARALARALMVAADLCDQIENEASR